MDDLLRPNERGYDDRITDEKTSNSKNDEDIDKYPEIGKLAFPATRPPDVENDVFEDNTGLESSLAENVVIHKPTVFIPIFRTPIVPSFSQLLQASARSTERDYTEPPSFKEFRRVCSEVLPGQLYVSGWLIAEDWEALSSRGITHVINASSSVSKCPFPDRIHYLPLSMEDSRTESIQCYIPICIDFIEHAIAVGGRVLIHCMEGVSRSCTIAIAYIMWLNKWTYSAGQEFVQSYRPVCQPNTGFICQLLDYEKVLNNPSVSRTYRLECKLLTNGSYIMVPVIDDSKITDPRIIYVKRQDNDYMVIIPTDTRHVIRELILMVCRQMFQYETPKILCQSSSPRVTFVSTYQNYTVHRQNNLDLSYSNQEAFFSLLKTEDDILPFGQAIRTAMPEIPLTSRSHRSHGSIDSSHAISGNRIVKVHQVLGGMTSLDEVIPYFDSDDLNSRCVYVFVVYDDGRTWATVWIGNEVPDDEHDSYQQTIASLLTCDINYIHQGQETDEFWDFFEQG
jgi:hypothetical protein